MNRRYVTAIMIALFRPNTSYNWHTGGRPQVDRRAIAGVWSLNTKPRPVFPMKEFTVYPKKKQKTKQPGNELPELLLNLKEDGSFQQCTNTDQGGAHNVKENAVDVDASWSQFQKLKESKAADLLKGTWDYIDGKLILAADRPLLTPTDDVRRAARTARLQPSSKHNQKKPDTLLEGRVVATYETRLEENPALATKQDNVNPQDEVGSSSSNNDAGPNEQRSSIRSSTIALDTHLSVPKGSIKVGRFFYPRNHPSFFEQPMFQPKKQGSFSLRQVLGSLNTATDQDEVVEKFKCSDFYNKTFLLTSHPIGFNQPQKGRERWSIRQNKMIHDPPSSKKAAAAEQNRPANIRVMQVLFHANNTFSTTGGLGESILRGKFDVIGQDKDHLWFQVWRFGFGRSVSGSVYSEGRMLTHDDAKVYWGHIRYEDADKHNKNQTLSSKEESATVSAADGIRSSPEGLSRLEVKGSVMFGWGIEPVPEARFIMRELTNVDANEEEDDDDEDSSMSAKGTDLGDIGIDWSNEDDSFQ